MRRCSLTSLLVTLRYIPAGHDATHRLKTALHFRLHDPQLQAPPPPTSLNFSQLGQYSGTWARWSCSCRYFNSQSPEPCVSRCLSEVSTHVVICQFLFALSKLDLGIVSPTSPLSGTDRVARQLPSGCVSERMQASTPQLCSSRELLVDISCSEQTEQRGLNPNGSMLSSCPSLQYSEISIRHG